MKIEKRQITRHKQTSENLYVSGRLQFYNAQVFCGNVYINLIAFKDNSFWGWHANEIAVHIHDYDDLFEGFIYYPRPEQFFDVLHELINWMNDLEHGILYFDEVFPDIDNFFPKLCERKRF